MPSQQTQPALKDEDAAHPVASDLRPTLRAIVGAFREGDFGLAGMPSVSPVAPATRKQIQDYIAEYGETLAELPDETWSSSVAQWMGTHWDVLVDLWTEESGESDLVLSARVFETDDGSCRIEVDSVHVP
jgi:DNA-binding cell septation regulator SpoVG